MTYIRRYMRPFVGTTIVIQDDAITSDKLDDKAVEEKHLADDVVSERTVGPSVIDSEAIKDKEVKTVDLADLSVTGPKIAESTIPESKLTFAPSTRPLSPGVASTEILDDAIVESKYANDSIPSAAYKPGSVNEDALAGDAVIEVKIKDRNVTSNKVALDSLGNEHLKADSVRGTEIQNGAVGTSELSTDAVETVKVKDKNITEPKLEDHILRKLLDSSQLVYDDFVGAALRSEWASSGDAGGSISRANSELSIKTNGTDDHKFRVNFGGDFFTSQGENPQVFLRGKQILTFIHIRFGLYKDDNNYALFDFDTDVDANWHLKTKASGVETDQSTFVAATNVMHSFLMEFATFDRVNFYIDGTLRASLTTNIPATILQPWMEVQNRSAATRTFVVDKFIIATDQSIGVPPP